MLRCCVRSGRVGAQPACRADAPANGALQEAGRPGPAANEPPMPALARPAPPLLGVLLLRRSVGAAAEARSRCVHCHRTPLTGEHVHIYDGAAGERLVCDLCRHHRRETPARTQLVHAGAERTVRVRRAAAA